MHVFAKNDRQVGALPTVTPNDWVVPERRHQIIRLHNASDDDFTGPIITVYSISRTPEEYDQQKGIDLNIAALNRLAISLSSVRGHSWSSADYTVY